MSCMLLWTNPSKICRIRRPSSSSGKVDEHGQLSCAPSHLDDMGVKGSLEIMIYDRALQDLIRIRLIVTYITFRHILESEKGLVSAGCRKGDTSSLPVILTTSFGRLLGPVGTFSIFRSVSMPSMTFPNTTCFPSRKSHFAVVMKN